MKSPISIIIFTLLLTAVNLVNAEVNQKNAKANQKKPKKVNQKISTNETSPSVHSSRIKIAAASFKDLLQNSESIVDKSLLIKSVLEAGPLITITNPRKWGKTINLQMLQNFLEIEFDSEGKTMLSNSTWAYKYFVQGQIQFDNGTINKLKNAPAISSYADIVEKYMSKYPVIYLDLSWRQCEKINSDVLLRMFRNRVSSVYQKFDFFIKLFTKEISSEVVKAERKTKLEKYLNKFKQYKAEEIVDDEGMVNSVKFLSEILSEHFGKTAFILIDSYDSVIEKAFFNKSSGCAIELEDAEKFLNFYSKFMHSSFRANKHIQAGVLTGVFDVGECFSELSLNRSSTFNILNKNLRPFHGFTKFEVSQLFDQFHISQQSLEEALSWYCGYRVADDKETFLCNPWSIVNFINTRKLETFWHIKEEFEIMPDIFNNTSIKEFFRAVLSGSADAKINRGNLRLHVVDLKRIKGLPKNITEWSSNDIDLISIIYYAIGYLTFDKESILVSDPSTIPVVMPCKEIENIIIDKMKTYYTKKFGNEANMLAGLAAEGLVQGLCTETAMSEKFSVGFHGLYSLLPKPPLQILIIDCNRTSDLDDLNFFVLLHVRSSHDFHIGMNVLYYEGNKQHRIYMTIYRKKLGAVYGYLRTYMRLMKLYYDEGNDLPQYVNYLATKGVKFVRCLILGDYRRDLYGQEVSMVVIAAPSSAHFPFLWSDTEKKFNMLEDWSDNLTVFDDLNKDIKPL